MGPFDVSEQLFNDYNELGYQRFMARYRKQFEYIFDSRHRFDDCAWNFDCLRVPDDYFALFKDWRSGSRNLVTGNPNRYLCLLERTYLRRILKPDTYADELFFNLIEEVFGQGISSGRVVVDNTDRSINTGILRGIAERSMSVELDWIWNNYSEDIQTLTRYWQEQHPNHIVSRAENKREAVKQFREYEVREHYDWCRTQDWNIQNLHENGIDVSKSYLQDHSLGTRDMKKYMNQQGKSRAQQYRDRKKAGEVLDRLSYDKALELYPEMRGNTAQESKDNFAAAGYEVSLKRIYRMNQEPPQDCPSPPTSQPFGLQQNTPFNWSGPSFDLSLPTEQSIPELHYNCDPFLVDTEKERRAARLREAEERERKARETEEKIERVRREYQSKMK